MHDFEPLKVIGLTFLTIYFNMNDFNNIVQFFVLIATFFYTLYKIKNERATYLDNKKKKQNE